MATSMNTEARRRLPHRDDEVDGDGGGVGSSGGGSSESRSKADATTAAAAPASLAVLDTAAWAKFPCKRMLLVFCLVRFLAGFLTFSTDCDEVYNYWEPTHYLFAGDGMQTWEYSPQYALRSYLYVWWHNLIVHFTYAVGPVNENTQRRFRDNYFMTRVILSISVAFAEVLLCKAISKRFGGRVAIFTALGLLVSPGMLFAAPAYLPSSFSMGMAMMAFRAYIQDSPAQTMFWGAISVLIGWPFVGVIFVPMGIHMLLSGKAIRVIVSGILSAALCLLASMAVDYHHYRKLVVPVWNIVRYNALGGGGGDGSNLYGTEPWSFYVKNLFLNFNFTFLVALTSAIVVPVLLGLGLRHYKLCAPESRWHLVCLMAPFWLWFVLMTARDHKEERFMFPVYPYLSFSAAVVLVLAERILSGPLQPSSGKNTSSSTTTTTTTTSSSSKRAIIARLLMTLYFLVVTVVSMSRSMGLMYHYYNSQSAWIALANEEKLYDIVQDRHPDRPARICVGKEWYRYPSSFFLGSDAELRFIKSGFTGQLPQPFSEEHGTWGTQPGFNDLNREEHSRYVDPSTCDYIVELDLGEKREPWVEAGLKHSRGQASSGGGAKPSFTWSIIYSRPFLNAAHSPALTRAFFIPILEDRNVYGAYMVLKKHYFADDEDKGHPAQSGDVFT